ncbi:NfeD family protein [Laspinema olomoucense]|uniref:NfeD family protein n=1 Tax=Laspinema olomoucense D3b TaxID=2953688 RepID=A0ABT2N583_9CYAN|nr:MULTISPECIES: NfeD family protein [unclassified Laspinema]MCT7970585.1 NfeD family protein [Laspinema sp. D3d]MCT7976920.1 NfeD family protein [Laspinema sp. D3b]MCT7989556.1 NfeD family protein [Laspinema sp. D3a]MCT7996843.1 NfeD family protein [Laspinema sp. D3c]
MMPIYLFCFGIGGIFVLFAMIGELDGGDFGVAFDADLEITETRQKLEGLKRKSGLKRLLQLPLFSLKFWTFGSCFFGLTGLVLNWLRPEMPAGQIAGIAGAMGIFCGSTMVGILRSLAERHANSLARSSDLVGLSAKVLLPFNCESRGKVRVNVKGAYVEFMAFTDESKSLKKGDQVLIVGLKNNRLWVVSEDCTDLNPSR